jgi:WXG100 family type VII secretion target
VNDVRYRVDLDLLAAHVADTRAFTERLATASSRLQATADGLAASWTGRAAEAHGVAHRQCAEASRELREALAALTAVADRAHAGYHAAASDNRELWGPLA